MMTHRSILATGAAVCALCVIVGACSSGAADERKPSPYPAIDYPNAGVRLALPPGWNILQEDTRVVAVCPGVGQDALLALGCNITVGGGGIPSYLTATPSSAKDMLDGIRRHTLATGVRELSWRTFTVAGMPASEQVVESTAPGGGATRGRFVNAVSLARGRVYSLSYFALPEFFDKHAEGMRNVVASFAPLDTVVR